VTRFLAVLVIAIGSFAMHARNDDPPPCAALDENATDILEDYRWSDTTTDTATISWRQRVSLPTVPVAQVLLVSDTTICRLAVSFYNAALADSGDTRQSPAATVIRWGTTRYAVSDTIHNAGEWTMHMVVDTSFSHVFGITSR
jgi:hypothetical protein